MARAKRKRKNKFAGAYDIYLTKNSVAVRKLSTTQIKSGVYRVYDNTKYYPKTRSNLNQAHQICGHIRYGR